LSNNFEQAINLIGCGRSRGGRGHGGRGQNGRDERGRYIPYTGYYTAEEWQSLSAAQRTRVNEARSQSSQWQGQPTETNQRQIGSVDITHIPDDTSAITTPTQATTGPTIQGSQSVIGNAGNQFGQRSRYIGMLSSGPRSAIPRHHQECNVEIARINSNCINDVYAPGMLELDSHADAACVGADCQVIAYTEKVCEVTPYHFSYAPMEDIPIVQAATAYTDPNSGKTYILIINEALYMGDTMSRSYINPNQMQHFGLIVNDVPKHLLPSPDDESHSIYIPSTDLRIPLQLKGTLSYVPTRYPSDYELQNCEWVQMTSDENWDPSSPEFKEREKQVNGTLNDILAGPINHNISSITANITNYVSDDEPELHHDIYPRVMSIYAAHTSSHSHSEELRNKLSRKFNVGLKTADRTLQATTQLALRQALHPIHRRFRTEVTQLRYPRLGGPHGKFHTDIFFATYPSLSCSTMGQMYTNDVHFTKFYPMINKSEAPDMLIKLIQDIGVPSKLHSDNANWKDE
jgi:hypothetical protein